MRRPGASAALLLVSFAAGCSPPPPSPGPAPVSRPAAAPVETRLAETLPDGFRRSGPPLRFGTEARPLANGTIFDYIDGGGVAYLEHGFTDLLHVEYADGERNAITLDVYRMATAALAREALADDRICPAGAEPLELDPAGKAYRFPPDYYFYFVHGRRLVFLRVGDDRMSARLVRFGAKVRSILGEEEP